MMSQKRIMLGLAENGSITAVSGSGIRIMSDSLIAFQPAIDEPSNMMPSRNASSPIVETCCAVCCHLPRGSVNRRSTYSTELSLSILSTLLTSLLGPDATAAGFFAILIVPVVCLVAAVVPPVTERDGTRQVKAPHHAEPYRRRLL